MIKIFNEILRKKRSYSVIRRFGHGFLLWKNFMQIYVNQFFDLNLCYLIETKLRQLHRRFDHSSTRKLYDLLERADLLRLRPQYEYATPSHLIVALNQTSLLDSSSNSSITRIRSCSDSQRANWEMNKRSQTKVLLNDSRRISFHDIHITIWRRHKNDK
jgi:hypothetical protein